ncbi:MAG: hypothetical protein ACOYMF_14380 [Bacteroidales bacterium]
MTIHDLKKLRASLPKKNLAILKKRTKFSTVYVWQVLNGKGTNDKIIEAALQLAQEYAKQNESRKQILANL